jgi:hypothetical protein
VLRRRVVRLARRWCPLRAVVCLLVRAGLVRVCVAAVGLRTGELVRTGLLLLLGVFLSGELIRAGLLLLLLRVFLSWELIRPGLLLVFLAWELVWAGLGLAVRELVRRRGGRGYGQRGRVLLGVGC